MGLALRQKWERLKEALYRFLSEIREPSLAKTLGSGLLSHLSMAWLTYDIVSGGGFMESLISTLVFASAWLMYERGQARSSERLECTDNNGRLADDMDLYMTDRFFRMWHFDLRAFFDDGQVPLYFKDDLYMKMINLGEFLKNPAHKFSIVELQEKLEEFTNNYRDFMICLLYSADQHRENLIKLRPEIFEIPDYLINEHKNNVTSDADALFMSMGEKSVEIFRVGESISECLRIHFPDRIAQIVMEDEINRENIKR